MTEAKEVQYKEPMRKGMGGSSYLVELIVMGKVVRVPAQQVYSIESLLATCTVVVATNYPNVSGFNILTEDGGTLLHESHPTPLIMHAAPIIQQITGQQPLKMAIPVVSSAKPEDVEKMFADAKARGKLIQ